MAKVIAVANQKGGVGKTALASNLSVGLAMNDKKVLVIDADPQGNLTSSLGIDNADELENTLASFIEREINEDPIDPAEYILHNDEGVDLMPCNIKLAGMDYMIMNALSREHLLDAFVSSVRDEYDYILIDCSPSLNLVTINVLTTADSVIIPVEASYLSMAGLQQLLASIGSTKRKLNRKYSEEYYALKAELAELQEQLSAFENAGGRAQKFLKLTERYAAFTDLTPAILNEFISRIEVHERDKKRAKQAIQHIGIYFNYIGKFENEVTQLTEPTEQEIRQMREKIEEAQKEKSRAYHRQYSREYRARNLEKRREYDRMKAREYRAKKKAQEAAAAPAQ